MNTTSTVLAIWHALEAAAQRRAAPELLLVAQRWESTHPAVAQALRDTAAECRATVVASNPRPASGNALNLGRAPRFAAAAAAVCVSLLLCQGVALIGHPVDAVQITLA